MLTTIFVIVAFVLALAATITAWIMIVPDRKRAGLNKFFQWIHDLFNFKSLWLEKILKFLYIFETLFCVICGFLMIFNFSTYESYNYSYGKFGTTTHTTWNGWAGILLLVFGPIIVRVIYEFMMIVILQLKNTMEINDKLNPQSGSRFEEKLKAEQEREERIAARRAEQQAAKEAYAQQQQYQQYMQAQQAQQDQYPQQTQQLQYQQQTQQLQYQDYQQYQQPADNDYNQNNNG